ncbi:MAG: hypothetical protein J6X60_10550, partial [Ruminiclostridium sp.]|nr:hypothetical protein [Ruminiclostridium sp.]
RHEDEKSERKALTAGPEGHDIRPVYEVPPSYQYEEKHGAGERLKYSPCALQHCKQYSFST